MEDQEEAMMMRVCLLLLLAAVFPLRAEYFSSEQKREIEQIIRDYLINNPRVLVEAMQEMQRKALAERLEAAKKIVAQNRELFLSAKNLVLGNREGNLILVEFLDYQCGYCKKMGPIVEEMIEETPDLKVVLMPLPIFGEASVYASKAVLAANEQGNPAPLHNALLREKKPLTPELVNEYAQNSGLDVEKLKKDMVKPEFAEIINQTRKIGEKMRINGTPYFVFLSASREDVYIVPGASSQKIMRENLDKLRKEKRSDAG